MIRELKVARRKKSNKKKKSIKVARKSRTPTRFQSTQPLPLRKLVYEAPKRGHNPWILFRSLLIINTTVVLTLAL